MNMFLSTTNVSFISVNFHFGLLSAEIQLKHKRSTCVHWRLTCRLQKFRRRKKETIEKIATFIWVKRVATRDAPHHRYSTDLIWTFLFRCLSISQSRFYLIASSNRYQTSSLSLLMFFFLPSIDVFSTYFFRSFRQQKNAIEATMRITDWFHANFFHCRMIYCLVCRLSDAVGGINKVNTNEWKTTFSHTHERSKVQKKRENVLCRHNRLSIASFGNLSAFCAVAIFVFITLLLLPARRLNW